VAVLRALKSRPAIAVVAFVVGATVAAGIAWAAVPSSTTGMITACYPTAGADKGALRVIDYQAGERCRSGEAQVRWQAGGVRWRGHWESTKTYYVGDVVVVAGSSYIATDTSSDVVPPNTTYWAVMAAAGATGPSGVALCGGWPHVDMDWSIPGSTPGNGCRLDGANLAGMTFTDANLTNARLAGANLSNAKLGAADLTGANLINANLTGAYMVIAHLNNASARGANFTDAILSNAVFTGVDTTNATWSNTTCPDGSVSSSNGTSPESCKGHGVGS
jgi:Pentapeptide repeats (8 copies)